MEGTDTMDNNSFESAGTALIESKAGRSVTEGLESGNLIGMSEKIRAANQQMMVDYEEENLEHVNGEIVSMGNPDMGMPQQSASRNNGNPNYNNGRNYNGGPGYNNRGGNGNYNGGPGYNNRGGSGNYNGGPGFSRGGSGNYNGGPGYMGRGGNGNYNGAPNGNYRATQSTESGPYNGYGRRSFERDLSNAIRNAQNVYRGGKTAFGGADATSRSTGVKVSEDFVPVKNVTVVNKIGPAIASWFGFWGTAFTALSVSGMVEFIARGEVGGAIGLGIFSVLGGLFSGSLLKYGIGRLKLYRQFKKVKEAMIGRTKGSVAEIAAETGIKEKAVIKGFKKMVSESLFPQGHISEDNSMILLNDNSYRNYMSEKAAKSKAAADEAARFEQIAKERAEKGMSSYDIEKAEKLLKTGREYVAKLKQADIDIENERISNDIVMIEQLAEKIFSYVSDNPAKSGQLGHFEDFYMPTVLKLLDNYKRYEANGNFASESDKAAKKEIEDSMDGVVDAFKQLYGNLTKTDNVDVSSDIATMNAMFAQDGLKESDFDVMKKDWTLK